MNLSNLKPAEGSTKTRKRIGRGAGSGLGGTSTRGHKGAKSSFWIVSKLIALYSTRLIFLKPNLGTRR